MRTKLLIAAAGLVGLVALPGAANAQPWGGYGFPPPFERPHEFMHRHEFLPPFPPPPEFRPRAFYPPPVMFEPPPPPPPAVYYARPVYRTARVYVAPHVIYRSVYRNHAVHRVVRRPVQPAAAAAPCTCALPSAAQSVATPAPAAEPAVPVTPSLPALRPAAPSNNVYPPERTQ